MRPWFAAAILAVGSSVGSSAFATTSSTDHSPTRLLRFADIYHNHVTFVYAGDIYIADVSGEHVQRLTTDKGLELFPKFSPDGKQIAFSAEFSGSRQVWVMDTDGSHLKQLTFYNDVGPMPPRGGFDYRVMDWTPDGQNVLVRANRVPWGKRMGRPYLVPVAGGMPQPLPIPESGGGMLSPDGKQLVYTPIDREWRTWKHYKGGRAQDVWTYNLEQNTSQQLTHFRGTDQQPLWVGQHIYYVSDRSDTLNLFRYNPDGEPTQLTHHKKYDVLWPSAGPDSIVYESAGYLHRFDPQTGSDNALPIHIDGVKEQTLPRYVDASHFIDSFAIAPDGKRAAFAARGEIFSVPAQYGEIRNLSLTPTVRERDVSWSPDGKHVAYLSDATGQYEIWIKDQQGKGKAKQITDDSAIWNLAPKWSPDNQYFAMADKNHKLWIVDLSGKRKLVDQAHYLRSLADYSWSPDGRYLVYTKTGGNGISSLFLYDRKTAQAEQLSKGDYSDFEPVFDPQGRYLYFLSDRDYNLAFSSYQFDYLYNRATRVYAVQLNDQQPALYRPQSDEVNAKQPTADTDTSAVAVKVQRAGFNERIQALPLPAGDYQSLAASADAVYVLATDNDSQVMRIPLTNDAEPAAVADHISDFKLSADGQSLLLQQGDNFALVPAKPKQKFADHQLDLSAMTLKVSPRQEWQQIYVDAWRVYRDWFYDPNHHGVDWQQIKRKYQPLADAVTSRQDLDYVLSEMGGELRSSHVYVQSGDQTQVKRIDTGLLGAELTASDNGYFRIGHIYQGENWHKAARSPLTMPGVKADKGDYIIAVDGIATSSVKNIYELLENKAGHVVTLTVNNKPQQKGSWQTKVTPVTSEGNLRYLDWVASRVAMVDKLSDGRIGYIHLPNTAIEGNRELIKRFARVANKDALIIDDRYNGGGFIPDRMIELLSRKTLNYWKWRGLRPTPTPMLAHDGPKVMLVNGYSSSGGDALPYYFRKLGLGKIIGTRTWGGLIGISAVPTLVDGGQVIPSNFRIMNTDGKWVVEDKGIVPDIKVIDRPELVQAGHDPSLERAVQELLKQLPANPRQGIKAPASPTDFHIPTDLK